MNTIRQHMVVLGAFFGLNLMSSLVGSGLAAEGIDYKAVIRSVTDNELTLAVQADEIQGVEAGDLTLNLRADTEFAGVISSREELRAGMSCRVYGWEGDAIRVWYKPIEIATLVSVSDDQYSLTVNVVKGTSLANGETTLKLSSETKYSGVLGSVQDLESGMTIHVHVDKGSALSVWHKPAPKD